MIILRMTALMVTFLLATTALADTDCTDSMAEWQSQESLRQKMIDNGWQVKRIKVDDGCYEIKGLDQNGNHVEAKFSPASLEILELKIKFTGPGHGSDYFKNRSGRQKSAGNQKPDN